MICSLSLSKSKNDWDFLFEVKLSIKHVINLEIKNHKTLISTEVINFVTYRWKGPCQFLNGTKISILFLVCSFYSILVNTFYFHKVLKHTQTN